MAIAFKRDHRLARNAQLTSKLFLGPSALKAQGAQLIAHQRVVRTSGVTKP